MSPFASHSTRRALGFIPTWIEAKAILGGRVRALLRDDVASGIDGEKVFGDLYRELDIKGQLHGRARATQSAWLWTKLALAGYILRTLGDGTEMASSIEGRTPFLDHIFFEVANRVPIARKVHEGVEKHALRQLMRPHLPDHIVARRKHPFLAPPLTRFAGENTRALIDDVLRSDALAATPFDRRRVAALLDRLPDLDEQRRAAAEPALMLALTATLLQRRFGLGGPR